MHTPQGLQLTVDTLVLNAPARKGLKAANKELERVKAGRDKDLEEFTTKEKELLKKHDSENKEHAKIVANIEVECDSAYRALGSVTQEKNDLRSELELNKVERRKALCPMPTR